MKLGLFTNMAQNEYRAIDALANSDALLIERNPSDYIWSRQAPTNFAKVQTKDVGTALHAALLEPETYDDLVLVSSVKGRQTKTFEQEIADNPNNIVLTAEEAEQVKIMVGSVMAHPTAAQWLNQKGYNECSVLAQDDETGIITKCRPDKNIVESCGSCIDVKTTGSMEDWRSDKEWINPMFKFGYGHQAAFYLHTLSLHYGFDVDKFVFVVVSTKVELGRYPVGVFEVTRDQLIAWGFWSRMLANIDKYAECKASGSWIHNETFSFRVDDDQYSEDVEVVYDGEQ